MIEIIFRFSLLLLIKCEENNLWGKKNISIFVNCIFFQYNTIFYHQKKKYMQYNELIDRQLTRIVNGAQLKINVITAHHNIMMR